MVFLGFLHWRFNQPWVENSIFDPLLRVRGDRGPTVCIVLTILYKELEHLWILVSTGDPGTNPHGYQGMTVVKFLGCLKAYADFQLCGGSMPLTPHPPCIVQGSVYFSMNSLIDRNVVLYCCIEFHSTVYLLLNF